RPHHGQRNLLFADERDELIELDGLDGHIHAVLGGAGVARRAENLLGARRLRQLPYQGMFAPTLPDDKYLHNSAVQQERNHETHETHEKNTKNHKYIRSM